MWRRMAVVAVLAGLTWATGAAAQWSPPPGGGGRGRGGEGGDRQRLHAHWEEMEARGALPLETMWAVLTFETGVSAAELDSLRVPFSEAWRQRGEILKHADKNSEEMNWKGVTDEFKDIRKNLDQKVAGFLTEDQQKAYTEQMKAYDRPRPPSP